MDTDILLCIKGLCAAYNGKIALNDVSLCVQSAERWAVIGPNGSGKSTLLKIAAGLMRPASGSIDVNGRALQLYKQHELARKIAWVPQPAGRSFPPFTVRDYVELARHPWRGYFDKDMAVDLDPIGKAIELADAMDLIERRMTELSGGELQRVLIAAAVAQSTPLMLLDEPESFLDPSHVLGIRRALDRVHSEKGTAFVTVHHDVNAVVSNCTHVLALKSGRTMFCGNVEEMSVEMLEELYEIGFREVFVQDSRKLFIAREAM